MQCYLIVSQLSGQALDVDGSNSNPGTRVFTWPKHGKDNQLWYDDLSTGTIRSKINNFCLDVENGELCVKPFQQGDPNQQWERRGNQITNRFNPNEVLDIVGSDKNQGAKVTKYQFNGGPNQSWTFEFVGGQAQPGYPSVGASTAYPGDHGSQPGYPGSQPGYPGSQPSYPGSQPGYPGSQPGYPGSQPGYPGSQPGNPGSQPGNLGSQSGYPGSQPGYPGSQPGYPGSQSGYPGSQPGNPGSQSGYPGSQPGYPGSQPGYPGSQSGYPGSQSGYPGSQPGYPGSQPGYPGSQPGYPSQQTYPAAQPAYTPAQQQRQEFYIVSEMNGKVLDIKGASKDANAQVIMWTKGSKDAKNQKWYFDQQGFIRSALNDFVFTAPSGQCIKMAPSGGDPHSQWRFDGNKVVNQKGDALDICRGSSSDGAEVCAYKPHGKDNQRWKKENA